MTVSPVATATGATVYAADLPAGRYVEWGPILIGASGALAILVVLMTFGAALGLTVASPQPYAGISAKGLAVLAGLYAALVHVASFGAGGYLAGRMRTPWATDDAVERQFRDGGHGFAVWALGVVIGAVLLASGIGAVVKTTVGATTAVAAAGTAGTASNAAADAVLQQLPSTDYAVDRLLAPGPAAPAAGTGGAVPASGLSRADIAAPIARTLAANMHNPQLDARDRAHLASLVSQRTGMPPADAEKRVDEAFSEFKAAEQKARDAADAARKATLIAAFLAAATMAIGCAAACGGAALGAQHRDERTSVVLFGSPRFW